MPDLQEALRRRRTSVFIGNSHVLTAEALEGSGRTAGGIAEFQAAAKVGPREPNVHFGIGYVYWKQHKYEEGQERIGGRAGH